MRQFPAKLCLLLLFSLFSQKTFCQNYMEGYVLTLEGDTIPGLIRNADYRYTTRVIFKNQDAPFPSLPTKKLSRIVVGKAIYDRIEYKEFKKKKGDKDEAVLLLAFAKLEIQDRMTLYSLLGGDPGLRTNYVGYSNSPSYYTYTTYRDYTVAYVVKFENGDMVRIVTDYFNENYPIMFGECPYLVGKIKTEKYTLYALKELVEEYNKCNK